MLWLACAAPPSNPVDTSALPSGWDREALVESEPLDGATIQEVLDEVVASVDAHPASELFVGYRQSVLAHSDRCVDWAEATTQGMTYVNWSGKREACDDPESGVFYGQVHHHSGEAFPSGLMTPTPVFLPEAAEVVPAWTLGGESLVGQGIVETPDGALLSMAGRFASMRASTEGHQIWLSQVVGSWVFDGEPAVDWMGPSHTLEWSVRAEVIDGAQQRLVVGSVDVLPQSGGTIYTEGLLVDEGCPGEPVGVVLVRGPDGRWAEVTFDGDCDGCGQSGEHEICVDTSGWLGWEDHPW